MKKRFQSFKTFLKRLLLFLFIGHIVYIIMLRWIDPPFTLTQLSSLIKGNGLKRDYINYDAMSSNAVLAVIAAEDQLFAEHNGFDWKSIQKNLEKNKTQQKIAGGSTISQQVAKNVFLWQKRNWLRKGLETYFTFMIELCWSKERTMEVYLNVIETGKGVFGIEAAAQHNFKKPASKLTRTEAALIASCLPNPHTHTIKPMSAQVANRYPWVLTQMNNLQGDANIKALLPLKQSTAPGKPTTKSR